MEEAYEREKMRQAELAASRLLRELGVRGEAHRQAIKDLQGLWLKRKDSSWAVR